MKNQMTDKIIEKFDLRRFDESNWDIVGVADHWTIKGFRISRRGNYFYTVKDADPNAINETCKNTAYKISSESLAITVHNYWVLDDWKPSKFDLDPRRLIMSLEVNSEAMRQLWINAFWSLEPNNKFNHETII